MACPETYIVQSKQNSMRFISRLVAAAYNTLAKQGSVLKYWLARVGVLHLFSTSGSATSNTFVYMEL